MDEALNFLTSWMRRYGIELDLDALCAWIRDADQDADPQASRARLMSPNEARPRNFDLKALDGGAYSLHASSRTISLAALNDGTVMHPFANSRPAPRLPPWKMRVRRRRCRRFRAPRTARMHRRTLLQTRARVFFTRSRKIWQRVRSRGVRNSPFLAVALEPFRWLHWSVFLMGCATVPHGRPSADEDFALLLNHVATGLLVDVSLYRIKRSMRHEQDNLGGVGSPGPCGGAARR